MKVFLIICLILSTIGLINDCVYSYVLSKDNPEKYKEKENELLVHVLIKGCLVIGCFSFIIKIF